jgi:nucleoside-diphosphate-sugar epimerase
LWGKEQHEPDPVPLDEDAPLRQKLYPYRGLETVPFDHKDKYEKILVERSVLSQPELPGTILRLPSVYGPGVRYHRLWPYVKRMQDRRPAILLEEGQARWRWTRGYVENVAAALALALTDQRAQSRVYNVGEQDALTEAECVLALGEAAGWSGRIVILPRAGVPVHLKTNFNWQYHLAMDTNRIRNELGYSEPIAREEGLRRTLEWEWGNPPEGYNAELFDYPAEDSVLQNHE